MAKITFGPIVSEARNKVGGVVYSRNTYGPYSRAFIVPPYTNTSAQAAARAALTALSQRWGSTLTDEQRAGWRSLGELYPHTDVFHQVNSRPGLQAYLRANLALSSVGSSPVDTAPQNWHATDPGEITATAVSGAPPTISVNAENPPAIAEAVQIWVTPQQSPGANYFYRRLRLVATAPAGTAGPWNPSAGWAARFAALAFPAKLGVGIRYVNVETGATGPMRTALITVTENPEDFMQATVNLTDADIKALPTAPFLVLAAPPPGFTHLPLALYLTLRKTAGAYTNVDPANKVRLVTQPAGVFAQVMLEDPAFSYPFFVDSDALDVSGPLYIPNAKALGELDNNAPNLWPSVGFSLSLDNQALGDLTGGNVANSLGATLVYVKIPVP